MKIIQENTLQQLKMSSWQYFETKTIKITKWQYDVKIYGAILYKINGIALALPMPLVGWGWFAGFTVDCRFSGETQIQNDTVRQRLIPL